MAALLRRIGTLDPAPPWGIATAIGFLIASFALMVISTTITGLVFGQTVLATLGGWSLGMVVMALLVTVARNRTPEDGAGLGIVSGVVDPARLVLTVLLGIGVAITLDLIGLLVTGGVASPVAELLVFFGGTPGTAVTTPFAADFPAWFIAILFLAVFQPVGEELVFRGVIYPALRQGLGAWMGFLLTAVFSGIFHLLAYTTQPQSTLPFFWYAFLLPLFDALFLGAVRANTGSTRSAIAAHVGLGLFAIMRTLLLAGG
jgi:membrane protease YdiL (CAAX protease family)